MSDSSEEKNSIVAKKEKNSIVAKASLYIQDLLKHHLSEEIQYHGISHTEDVVEAAEIIGEKRGLSEDKMEILLLAAWFHDAGFVETHENHEEASKRIANQWLEEQDYPQNKKEQVLDLIISTRQGETIEGDLAEILHDADLSHIGRKRFFRRGELYRVEEEKLYDKKYSELSWEKSQYRFLINHNFLTNEAQEEYGKRRVKNIKDQRKNILKAQKVTTRKNTGKDFGRGIDTLYRSNYRAHLDFSSIADGKANMMISINTILISVIVTLSGASLSISQGFAVERFRYTIPILVLLVGSLISVLFAVLSAKPKVTEKKIDMKDVKDNKISLLYFGNFLRVPKNDFMEYLNGLKTDQKRLYDSMSIDIYNLGIVLKEKYRLLSISYNVFMTGLSISVIAFIIIFIYTNN
jgi:predicted metal-dependent HD superfamily phosphohydrolase